MEDRKVDRPKSSVFTRIVKTFIKPNHKGETDESSEEEIANRRGKGIFNSLRKKFKANRSKQKVVATDRRSCFDGFRESDIDNVIYKSRSNEQFDNNDNSEYIDRQENHFSSNSVFGSSSATLADNRTGFERNELNLSTSAPPVPPRRTIITSRTRQTLDDEDNEDSSPQYLDANELNPEGNSSQNNSPSRPSDCCTKSLVAEQFNLAKHGWFWGPLSRQETENNLRNQPDGSFLVRESRSARYIYTLSFRCYGQTMHAHIEYNQGKFSMGEQLVRSTVSELIDEAIAISKETVFSYSRSRNETDPGYPVRLTRPISRFMEVRSLQYLSRFVIRQYINVNNIQKLPLPNSLKGYLQQTQY